MKKIKKIMITMLAVLTVLPCGAIAASAAQTEPSASVCAVKPGDSTQEDIIITYWREYNGVKQYRRWNETKDRWEDPYWITP